MDLPRIFTIRESRHRIHNPIDEPKLDLLGRVIPLDAGTSLLDLACGSGEMLCRWARDHGVIGTGVDLSSVFTASARDRAAEFGVTDRVTFVQADAAGYVADTPVDITACIGATWIGGGLDGTIELLERSLRPGGLLLVGEPFWRRDPPDQETIEACHATTKADFRDLPGLVAHFGELGWDLVQMVLADQDSWDRYVAAQWFNIREWLDVNPGDEMAGQMRDELHTAPVTYVRYEREYLGWGVFVLKKR